MATYRTSKPCVVALNCMEGCRTQAARMSDLFSFQVVGLSEGMLEKLEIADVVIIHSLHYLPRAAQRKLSPSQLLLCLGSSVDTRVVESSLAEELGLRLLHVDVPRTDEVADSVLALILGLLRRTHVLAAQGCTSASWFAGFKSAWHGMRRLNGMALGLVGAGETARAVALRALAFGMKVHFVDIEKDLMHLSDTTARAFCQVACEEDSLEALLAASDVVSLHVALTDATLHLINQQSAKHFRKGALLINVSSCHLVDDSTVKQALNDGTLASCALDGVEGAQWMEAWVREFPHVLILPRSADHSEEVWASLHSKALHAVKQFIETGEVPSVDLLESWSHGVDSLAGSDTDTDRDREKEREEEQRWRALAVALAPAPAAPSTRLSLSPSSSSEQAAMSSGSGKHKRGGGTKGQRQAAVQFGSIEHIRGHGHDASGDGGGDDGVGAVEVDGEDEVDVDINALQLVHEACEGLLKDGMLVALRVLPTHPLTDADADATTAGGSLSDAPSLSVSLVSSPAPAPLWAAHRTDSRSVWPFAAAPGLTVSHPATQFVVVCDKGVVGFRSAYANGKFLQVDDCGDLQFIREEMDDAETWQPQRLSGEGSQAPALSGAQGHKGAEGGHHVPLTGLRVQLTNLLHEHVSIIVAVEVLSGQ